VNDSHALLDRIAQGLENGVLTQREAAQYVGQHLCRLLYCSRATLWSLGGPPDAPVLAQVGGFDACAGRPLIEPVQLAPADCPDWLAALSRTGLYVSNDAAGDVALRGLRAGYLEPLRIGAAIHVTIGVNGTPSGVLFCEQCGSARAWSPAEIATLKRIAVAISIRRARRVRRGDVEAS
jgi:GAF domain-containing protein